MTTAAASRSGCMGHLVQHRTSQFGGIFVFRRVDFDQALATDVAPICVFISISRYYAAMLGIFPRQ